MPSRPPSLPHHPAPTANPSGNPPAGATRSTPQHPPVRRPQANPRDRRSRALAGPGLPDCWAADLGHSSTSDRLPRYRLGPASIGLHAMVGEWWASAILRRVPGSTHRGDAAVGLEACERGGRLANIAWPTWVTVQAPTQRRGPPAHPSAGLTGWGLDGGGRRRSFSRAGCMGAWIRAPGSCGRRHGAGVGSKARGAGPGQPGRWPVPRAPCPVAGAPWPVPGGRSPVAGGRWRVLRTWGTHQGRASFRGADWERLRPACARWLVSGGRPRFFGRVR
jgi:hypothetical protein